MSRTQDNFASNMGGVRRSGLMVQNQGSPREETGEYQRIYGTGKGRARDNYGPGGVPNLGDDLSDWERQSHRSGRSQMSQFS